MDTGDYDDRESLEEDLRNQGINFIENFDIFPNPNTGEFNLDVNALQDIVSITIMKADGQVVYHEQMNNGLNSLSLKLSKGMYLMKMVTSGGVVQKTLIINWYEEF